MPAVVQRNWMFIIAVAGAVGTILVNAMQIGEIKGIVTTTMANHESRINRLEQHEDQRRNVSLSQTANQP